MRLESAHALSIKVLELSREARGRFGVRVMLLLRIRVGSSGGWRLCGLLGVCLESGLNLRSAMLDARKLAAQLPEHANQALAHVRVQLSEARRHVR